MTANCSIITNCREDSLG